MIKRISITTGTRADYGFLIPILKQISKTPDLKYYLIVSGMHLSKKYGYTINQILKDNFKIYAKIYSSPSGNTPYHVSKALGKSVMSFSDIFQKLKPDVNIIFGDRDEQLASGLAAYHMNILNIHVHGGDVSGGIDEYNRHAMTKISNVHFAASKGSQKRILKMGENSSKVFFVGSTAIDSIKNKNIPSKKSLESKLKLKIHGNEILLLFHPTTTESKESEKQITNILNAVVKLKNQTIAILPNNDAGNYEIREKLIQYSKKYDFIKLFSTLERNNFLGLLKYCGLLLGNSSSGFVEGSYFSIPVLNIGIRQHNREGGNNIAEIKKFDTNLIYNKMIHALKTKNKGILKKTGVYGNGHASEKIIKIISSLKIDNNSIKKELEY